MAVRFDAAADVYSRTTNLPSATSFTLAGWFYLSVDTNASATFFSRGFTDTEISLQTDVDGTTLRIWDGQSSDSVTGSVLSLTTWYHLALTYDGSNIRGYLNGVLDITNPATSTPYNAQYIGNANDGTYLDGRAAAVKAFSAVLTAEEIKTEIWQYCPIRFANLNAFYPMLSVADGATDYSANGYNNTAGGTLATEEGPPIPWRIHRRRQVSYAVSGATTMNPAQAAMALVGQNTSLGFAILMPDEL